MIRDQKTAKRRYSHRRVKDSLEEIATVLRDKDAETLQQMIDGRDRADQKYRELKESLENPSKLRRVQVH